MCEGASRTSARPGNIWTGEEGARVAVEQLSDDLGMDAIHGGALEHAGTQEAFAFMLMSSVKDIGDGLLYYRFAAPQNL